MAKRKVLVATVPNLVFKCIWFVFAAVFFGIGLGYFLSNKDAQGFLAWLGAGGICCVPVLTDIIKMVLDAGKEGARKGANDYTVTVTSSSVRVRNHPVSGFIFGILGGLIGSALIGLVYLGIKLIICLIEIIRIVVYLVQHSPKKPKKPEDRKDHNNHKDDNNKCNNNDGKDDPKDDRDEEEHHHFDKRDNDEKGPNNNHDLDNNHDQEQGQEYREEKDQYQDPNIDETLINQILEAEALVLFDNELVSLKDRYQVLGQNEIDLENNEPVKLTGYQIVKDSISDRKILRLSALVNSDIEIKKICLNIVPIDINNRALGQIKNLEYDVKLVKKDDKFLANYGVIIPDEAAFGEVLISKIVFSDGLFWNKSSVKYPFITNEKIEHDLGL